MAKSGDKFWGPIDRSGKGSGSLYQPTEERWTNKVLYALQQLMGIGLPDAQQGTVLTKSRAFGEASDQPVNLSQTAANWTLIGTLKAYSVLFLDYQAKLISILSDTNSITASTTTIATHTSTIAGNTTSIDAKLSTLDAKIDALTIAINNIKVGVDSLNTTAGDINSGVTAAISELGDIDVNLTTLNTTATSIRTRMDGTFTTI